MLYGLSQTAAGAAPRHATVMHPRPMLRAWRSRLPVADSRNRRCCNRFPTVCVRMAVLFHLLVGTDEAVTVSYQQVLIRGVRLYGEGDPVDVLVADGQIAEIGPARPDDADVIDATGRVLLPGFVDLHPPARAGPRIRRGYRNRFGRSGSGRIYTAVFAMANTDPVADSPGGDRPRLAARPAGRPGRRAPGGARSPSARRASNSPRWV